MAVESDVRKAAPAPAGSPGSAGPAVDTTLDRPHLGLARGWALLKTPSSEAGIQAYYRALLGRPAEAEALRAAIEALRSGRATRIDVLAAVAGSPERRERGARGAGVALIRLAGRAFRLSGARRLLLRRRARHMAQHPLPAASPAEAPGAAEPTADAAALLRRIVMLEGAVTRLEVKLRATRLEASASGPDETQSRLEALERAVLDLLNERAEQLRHTAAAGDA